MRSREITKRVKRCISIRCVRHPITSVQAQAHAGNTKSVTLSIRERGNSAFLHLAGHGERNGKGRDMRKKWGGTKGRNPQLFRSRISRLVSANPNMHEISGARRNRKTLTHFHPIDPLSGRVEFARKRARETEKGEGGREREK